MADDIKGKISVIEINGDAYEVKDSEVKEWARADEKPEYTPKEVGAVALESQGNENEIVVLSNAENEVKSSGTTLEDIFERIDTATVVDTVADHEWTVNIINEDGDVDFGNYYTTDQVDQKLGVVNNKISAEEQARTAEDLSLSEDISELSAESDKAYISDAKISALGADGSMLYSADYSTLNMDYSQAEEYFRSHYIQIGGCSTYISGDTVGRNYDWKYDNSAIFNIRTEPNNGRYGVTGNASISSITDSIAKSRNSEAIDAFKILPFILLDGVNDKGLYANVNVRAADGQTTTGTGGGGDLCALMLVRAVLDNCKTCEEAIDFLENCNIWVPHSETISEEYHWILKDESSVYVVEIYNNELMWYEYDLNNTYVTNFSMVGKDGTTWYSGVHNTRQGAAANDNFFGKNDHPMGVERSDILKTANATTANEILEAMKSVAYSKSYTNTDNFWYSEFSADLTDLGYGDLTWGTPVSDYSAIKDKVVELYEYEQVDGHREGKTWHTVYTVIYEMDKSYMTIYPQEDYETGYKVFFSTNLRFETLEGNGHWHTNKDVLDKFSVNSEGMPTYNGQPVGGSVEIYDQTTGKSKYTLSELSQFNNIGVTLTYRGYVLVIFSASALLFRAYYFNPVNHTVRKFDVKDDKSFFWFADIALADNSDVSSAIQSEASTRQARDNALASRIDDIIAKSDVVDVVGTYADLENYDTSALGDNDLIKVLQDETKLYNRTYYRWIVADEEFTYVGEEPNMFIEIYDYDTELSRFTPTELYNMYFNGGSNKIYRYRGSILTVTAIFRNQFSGQYLNKNTGKVFLVTVNNNKTITVEKVVHYARSILTDYGVEIGFYTYADGTERPYFRKVADT